ncbi:MAG TPA: cytochrome P450, partial [Halieaceae bacterium]|nr:cytochrome P450 [Halieaceae bacterium]
HMLGIDEEEANDALLDQLNQAIADSFLVLEMRALTDKELAPANRQIDFLETFFQSIFERRRAQPREDLATALLNAREGDSKLTDREMVTVAIALFGAGFETTAHMIGNGVLTLHRYPKEWQKLVDDPDLAPSATEEVLRYESSLIATYRTAFNDTEIGGQTVKAGERVLALLAAGNRDPSVFPKPNEFDICREGAHHLAFGGGIHFCVGAVLARLEGDIALRALAKRLPGMQVDTSNPLWRPGFMFRGLEQLVIRW